MSASHDNNRFEDFFEEARYVILKNHLYNYRLRKRAVEAILAEEPHTRILEVGSGLSPVMTQSDRVVYSELSFVALRQLKRIHGRGAYVVADATRLPFRPGAFSHAVASEVLEHLPDDKAALAALSEVLAPDGALIVTYPHRKAYFAYDDRFVNHYRRYEAAEMAARLEAAGLTAETPRKVLGPLDKVAALAMVTAYAVANRGEEKKTPRSSDSPFFRVAARLFQWANTVFAAVAWLDARLVPRAWATVLLVRARKERP